ncbi:MAG: hypothetical protein ACD_62C00033G0004 [uncultured bacterium]|nr:MAG: hypothetical protein ACD_62C00033G0004 [uncultured bacterium]
MGNKQEKHFNENKTITLQQKWQENGKEEAQASQQEHDDDEFFVVF